MKEIIICGTRDFDNYKLLASEADSFLLQYGDDITLVLGGQRKDVSSPDMPPFYVGADWLAEEYARMRQINFR